MTDVQLFFDGDVTPVNQRSSVYQWDDFNGPGGDLNWDLIGTGATTTQGNATTDHPGSINLLTDTTSGHSALLQRYDYPENLIQTLEWTFRVPLNSGITVRVGVLNSFSSPGFGVDIEFDTVAGDTALSLCKWVSSVRTVGATLPLTVSHWYRMNWSRSGSGAGTLTLNDLTATTSQSYAVTGLTASAAGNVGAYVKTNVASQSSCILDWMLVANVGMNR